MYRTIGKTTLWFAFLLMILPAQAGVDVDYDPEVDFSAYKTFAWQPGTPAPSPLMHKRIEGAIEDQLKSLGLQKTDGEADVYVIYHVALDQAQTISVDDFGYSRRWRGMGSTTVNVYDVTVGTLIVDLLDGGSGDGVWRGRAEKELSGKPSPEKIDKKVQKILTKMFRDYPPE